MTTTSINAVRVKIVIIKLGFVKLAYRGRGGTEQSYHFHRTRGSRKLYRAWRDALLGPAWPEGGQSTPAQEDSLPGCRGPHSAAFPAPPLCLPSPDTTYHSLQRSRNSQPAAPLGPHRRWDRGTQRRVAGSATTNDQAVSWSLDASGRWGGKALQTPPHDPTTSADSALPLAEIIPKRG